MKRRLLMAGDWLFGTRRGTWGHRGLFGPLQSPFLMRAVALVAVGVAAGLLAASAGASHSSSALIGIVAAIVTQEVIDRAWVQWSGYRRRPDTADHDSTT